MRDKSFEKYKEARVGKELTKETTRAKYERLKSENLETPGLRGESLIDAKIKKAMAEGAFDNLAGKGEPIDLKKYYDLPEHLRVGYQMLKNSGFVPKEVMLKKEMETLKEKIEYCRPGDEKQRLMQRLAEVSQCYHFCMEYNRDLKKRFP